MRPTTSPGCKEKLTSLSALMAPKFFDTLRTSSKTKRVLPSRRALAGACLPNYPPGILHSFAGLVERFAGRRRHICHTNGGFVIPSRSIAKVAAGTLIVGDAFAPDDARTCRSIVRILRLLRRFFLKPLTPSSNRYWPSILSNESSGGLPRDGNCSAIHRYMTAFPDSDRRGGLPPRSGPPWFACFSSAPGNMPSA